MQDWGCSMTDTTYNGWTNWETWCVNVHDYLPEEIIREDVRERLQEEMEEGNDPLDFLHDVTYTVSKGIREDFDETFANVETALQHAGYNEAMMLFVSDIFGGFASSVNWYELAGHIVNETWQEMKREMREEGKNAEA